MLGNKIILLLIKLLLGLFLVACIIWWRGFLSHLLILCICMQNIRYLLLYGLFIVLCRCFKVGLRLEGFCCNILTFCFIVFGLRKGSKGCYQNEGLFRPAGHLNYELLCENAALIVIASLLILSICAIVTRKHLLSSLGLSRNNAAGNLHIMVRHVSAEEDEHLLLSWRVQGELLVRSMEEYRSSIRWLCSQETRCQSSDWWLPVLWQSQGPSSKVTHQPTMSSDSSWYWQQLQNQQFSISLL